MKKHTRNNANRPLNIVGACLTMALIAAAILSIQGCRRTADTPLTLHWELVANDVEPGICQANFTITNTSTDTLRQEGWQLGFALMSLHPIQDSAAGIIETEVQASYHTITPTAAFTPIAPGQSHTFTLRYRGAALRESSHPEGFFLVCTPQTSCQSTPISIPCTYTPFTSKRQMVRGITTWDKTPYADGEYMFGHIQRLLQDTLPHAAKYASSTSHASLAAHEQYSLPLLPMPKQYSVSAEPHLPLSAYPRVYAPAECESEWYHIDLVNDTLRIGYSDEAGRFYADVTLSQLADDSLLLSIYDGPQFHHRALMLDIARNFYPADSIMRVIDMMASLKLNTLHLHLADDEGWRIAIPALPQLTANGSSRGYTTDERHCLYPAYNGGWDANNLQSTANGFLTREDYIAILRYAAARHITVMPEIDMPGHMRAIKKAMGGVLTDSLMEQRSYLSAQNYTDNVIAVTNEQALPTMRTIIDAFVTMHQDAGCPLRIFNIGGDEVAKGALTREEHQAFINGVIDILAEYNLQPAGWEEIDHFCAPETHAICYSWHPGEKKAREMADCGYPVVLAAADHLYFDFAYCHHHEEKGLNWGGYTDEFAAFDWLPIAHPNVIGMSAQLWAEVIRSFSQVEWQLYPKIFGLAERAWNASSVLSVSDYAALVYGHYLPLLASGSLHSPIVPTALPAHFHLLQPGIHLHYATPDSTLATVEMQTIYPDGQITYTLQMADGTATHGTYTEPFALPPSTTIIQAQWHYLGKSSATTWRWCE